MKVLHLCPWLAKRDWTWAPITTHIQEPSRSTKTVSQTWQPYPSCPVPTPLRGRGSLDNESIPLCKGTDFQGLLQSQLCSLSLPARNTKQIIDRRHQTWIHLFLLYSFISIKPGTTILKSLSQSPKQTTSIFETGIEVKAKVSCAILGVYLTEYYLLTLDNILHPK